MYLANYLQHFENILFFEPKVQSLVYIDLIVFVLDSDDIQRPVVNT
jgi:hypothetical protein